MGRFALACLFAGWIGAVAAAADDLTAGAVTALDDYVSRPDSAYAWRLAHTSREDGVTTYVIDLTSQTWLTPEQVDRTTWKHWLTITKPDGAAFDTAMMFIGGGSNDREMPTRADDRVRQIAAATRSVVAEISMIPNQPLTFHQDGKPRKEDDLIAYAWDQYFKTKDPLWLPRLPMVKSVVRAMDATQEMLASAEGGKLAIKKFVVAGGSKRGWTTWMTAAVDKRVCAIAPIVIDVLNVKVSMDHHYSAYGFWAPALDNYVEHRIVDRRDDPVYMDLLRIEDPYAYRARFTMPKCVINATGDQFFLPDSSKFYFDDLPAEKHLCYVPNGDHGLKGTTALESLVAFYWTVLKGVERPKFSWTLESDNRIRVRCETKPRRVLLWQAHNPKARDFRVESIGRAYQSSELRPVADGEYVAEVETPKEGWTALLAELEYDLGGPAPLRLTTPVSITPDSLPFKDKLPPGK